MWSCFYLFLSFCIYVALFSQHCSFIWQLVIYLSETLYVASTVLVFIFIFFFLHSFFRSHIFTCFIISYFLAYLFIYSLVVAFIIWILLIYSLPLSRLTDTISAWLAAAAFHCSPWQVAKVRADWSTHWQPTGGCNLGLSYTRSTERGEFDHLPHTRHLATQNNCGKLKLMLIR